MSICWWNRPLTEERIHAHAAKAAVKAQKAFQSHESSEICDRALLEIRDHSASGDARNLANLALTVMHTHTQNEAYQHQGNLGFGLVAEAANSAGILSLEAYTGGLAPGPAGLAAVCLRFLDRPGDLESETKATTGEASVKFLRGLARGRDAEILDMALAAGAKSSDMHAPNRNGRAAIYRVALEALAGGGAGIAAVGLKMIDDATQDHSERGLLWGENSPAGFTSARVMQFLSGSSSDMALRDWAGYARGLYGASSGTGQVAKAVLAGASQGWKMDAAGMEKMAQHLVKTCRWSGDVHQILQASLETVGRDSSLAPLARAAIMEGLTSLKDPHLDSVEKIQAGFHALHQAAGGWQKDLAETMDRLTAPPPETTIQAEGDFVKIGGVRVPIRKLGA